MQYCLWRAASSTYWRSDRRARLSGPLLLIWGSPCCRSSDTAESSGEETGRRKSHKGERRAGNGHMRPGNEYSSKKNLIFKRIRAKRSKKCGKKVLLNVGVGCFGVILLGQFHLIFEIQRRQRWSTGT